MSHRDQYINQALSEGAQVAGDKQRTEYRGKVIITEAFYYGSQLMHRGRIAGEKDKGETVQMFRSGAICLDHFKTAIDLQLDGGL